MHYYSPLAAFFGHYPTPKQHRFGSGCPCKVDLTAVLSATLCQSSLDDNELRLGLGWYGEYVDRSIRWTLHCRLRQAAM